MRKPFGTSCARGSPAPGRRSNLRLGRARHAERIVDAYFWRDHFDDRECCCPLHGMASNVSCSGEAVKAAYHEVAERAVRVLEAHLSEPEARERAFAFLALPWPDQPREFGCGRAMRRRLSALCEDDVRGVRGGNVLGALVAKLRCVDSGKKVLPGAEDNRRNGNVHLVDESRAKVLPNRNDSAARPATSR
jgi:hypothetical protein